MELVGKATSSFLSMMRILSDSYLAAMGHELFMECRLFTNCLPF